MVAAVEDGVPGETLEMAGAGPMPPPPSPPDCVPSAMPSTTSDLKEILPIASTVST